MRNTMESADPHASKWRLHQRFNSSSHFRGGLICEGHGEYTVGRHPVGLYQPGNPMSQYPSFATAGTRQN